MLSEIKCVKCTKPIEDKIYSFFRQCQYGSRITIAICENCSSEIKDPWIQVK